SWEGCSSGPVWVELAEDVLGDLKRVVLRCGDRVAAAGEDPVKGDTIAEAQDIPLKFLENILGELKHHGVVASRRGAQGGYWLAKPAGEISLARVVRAVGGPPGTRPGPGAAGPRDRGGGGGLAPGGGGPGAERG